MKRRLSIVGLFVVLLGLALWWPAPRSEAVALPVQRPEVPVEPDEVAVAEPDVPSGDVQVDCPMVTWGPRTPEHIAVLVFEDEENTEIRWVPGEVDEAWLSFRAPTAEGAGLVTLRGHLRSSVVWWTREDGGVECHFPEIPEREPVGKLLIPATELTGLYDSLTLRVCEPILENGRSCRFFSAYEGQGEVQMDHRTGTFEASACRRNGELNVCHDLGDLTVREGTHEMEVDWPEAPAGTGLTASSDGEIVVIETVYAGGPGDRAGIVPGDQILEMSEGPWHRPTGGFKDIMVGAEGDVLTLRILDDQGEREVSLALEPLGT